MDRNSPKEEIEIIEFENKMEHSLKEELEDELESDWISFQVNTKQEESKKYCFNFEKIYYSNWDNQNLLSIFKSIIEDSIIKHRSLVPKQLAMEERNIKKIEKIKKK